MAPDNQDVAAAFAALGRALQTATDQATRQSIVEAHRALRRLK
jgi:hypothetical protein